VVSFGYADLSQEVSVEEDQTTTVNLQMLPLPLVTVSGTVYLPGGNPVDGGVPAAQAFITIKDTPVPPVTADDQGAYSLVLPAGTDYQLQVSAGADGYLAQTVPFLTDLELDLYLDTVNAEGFESGDMESHPWFMTGGADWYAQSADVQSGSFASRSGEIGNINFAQMQLFVDCGDGGDVSFWFKVSSAAGSDFLRFYVGNDMVAEWAGEVGWTQYTHPVESGVVSFRWRYQKDFSGQAGQDCAWVDNITWTPISSASSLSDELVDPHYSATKVAS